MAVFNPSGIWRPKNEIVVLNEAGEPIPAFAAMEVLSIDRNNVRRVTKPNKDDSPTAIFNGPVMIPKGKPGNAQGIFPAMALVNRLDGLPGAGEALGTRNGYWEIFRGYNKFLNWGGDHQFKSGSTGLTVVQRDLDCTTSGASRRRRVNLNCPPEEQWATVWNTTFSMGSTTTSTNINDFIHRPEECPTGEKCCGEVLHANDELRHVCSMDCTPEGCGAVPDYKCKFKLTNGDYGGPISLSLNGTYGGGGHVYAAGGDTSHGNVSIEAEELGCGGCGVSGTLGSLQVHGGFTCGPSIGIAADCSNPWDAPFPEGVYAYNCTLSMQLNGGYNQPFGDFPEGCCTGQEYSCLWPYGCPQYFIYSFAHYLIEDFGDGHSPLTAYLMSANPQGVCCTPVCCNPFGICIPSAGIYDFTRYTCKLPPGLAWPGAITFTPVWP